MPKDTVEFDLTVHPGIDNDTIKFCVKDTSINFSLKSITDPGLISSASGGTWSTRNMATNKDTSLTNATGEFVATKGLSAGVYRVKYSTSGYNAYCSDSDSIFILISPLDTSEIINLPSLCSSDSPCLLYTSPSPRDS